MSIARLLTQPVVILRARVSANRYGDDIVDWANTDETSTLGWLTQLSGREVLGTRDAQVSDWKLYLAADVDIDAGDRVLADGVTYEVDGPPHHAHTPRGPHHIEVALHAVTG